MSRYAETFEVFLRHSLEYDQLLNTIREHIAKLPKKFSLLDVGAGTGEIIEALAKTPENRPSSYTAFEPNPAHIEALRKVLAGLSIPDQKLIPDFFDAKTALTEAYDFILFSHSLYWMSNPPEVFSHAISHLKDGGIAMGILQGPYSVHTLLALYESSFTRTTPMLQNNAYSSFELVEGLRLLGHSPTVKMLPTPLDMTHLFDRGAEKQLHELMSFCLQLEFGQLSEMLQAEIMAFVQGAIVEVGGRSLWYIPNAIVTVVP